MAGEDNSFNLGIIDSQIYGSASAAEAFLSDTTPITGDPKDLIKIDEEEEAAKAAIAKQGKIDPKTGKPFEAAPKKNPTQIADTFLNETEDEELDNENEEEDEEAKKALLAKKAPTETIDNQEDGSQAGKLNQFQAIAKQLYKSGVLSMDEDETEDTLKLPATGDELLDKFNREKQRGATEWLENYLGQFGEDRRELFQAIFMDGVDPKAYLPSYNQTQNFESVDLTSKENQKDIVREYYTRAGWDKDKIEKKIAKLDDYADLEDEAKTVQPQLVTQDKQKMESMRVEKQKEREAEIQQDTEYKNSIQKVLQEKLKIKDFDGIPLTEKRAVQASDFMYTKKWKTPDGQLLTDFDKFILESKRPDNIAIRAKISLLALDGFDFSKIEKKAISKQSTGLFADLTMKDAKKSNTTKNDTVANAGGW